LLVALASAALGVVWAYLLGFRDAGMGLICLGFICVGFIGLVGWEILHPPPFKIDVGPINVDYEFRDRQYAHDFAKLNDLAFPS
jgi:hypothetical protein